MVNLSWSDLLELNGILTAEAAINQMMKVPHFHDVGYWIDVYHQTQKAWFS